MEDTCNFWWILGKGHLGLYSIAPLIHRMISLSEACQQVTPSSHLIALWFAKLQARIFRQQAPYWSIPKSPLNTMTFLHFLESSNMASLQSNMCSHFSFHLRNLWYKPSFTVKSIFGPLIYGINMGCTKGCDWLVDGWMSWGLWTSISTSEFEDSCETIELSWQTLVLTTQAEFIVGQGISGLCIFVQRPFPSRFNN